MEKVLALAPTKTDAFGIVTFGAMIPTSDNYVRLDPSSKDEFGLPLLDLHIRHDEDSQRTTRSARDRLLTILESAGYRCRVRDVVEKPPGASVHYGGTVRMHNSPRYGMLNAWNRLHAIDNVAVVDAACFTTGAEKNPTLTAMALAARAGDRLAEDLKTL
jgi:choline dehydrogenase-like flavoprotein